MRIFYALIFISCSTLTKIHATDLLGDTEIISQEVNSITGNLSIRMRVWSYRDFYFQNLPTAKLPLGWTLINVSQSKPGNYIIENDSIDFIFVISHPLTLPFFPKEVELSLSIQASSGVQQLQSQLAVIVPSEPLTETLQAKGQVYFTPYNSVEIWSERDFLGLRRTWIHPKSIVDTTRIYIPKTSIPTTNILATDSIPDDWTDDWKDDLQGVQVPGLAYLVQMRAVHPDTIAVYNDDDGLDSLYDGGIEIERVSRRFSGTITGRLVTNVLSDIKIQNLIPLKGVLVKLKERDRLFSQEFAEITTDANGNFTINYSVSQSSFEGKNIEIFLKIKSKNRNYQIKVKDAAVLGSSYDIAFDLGKHGTFASINVGDILLDTQPWRLLHWTVRAWDYVEESGFLLFNKLSILPYRKNSNFIGDGLFGFSAPLTRPTIRMTSSSGRYEGTIRHEFGHFMMWCIQNRNYITVWRDPNSENHYWDRENTSRIAWSEGWADAIEMILDAVFWSEDNEYGFDEFERTYEARRNYTSINRGIWSEYYFACALYDLWDGPGKGIPTNAGPRYVGHRDVDQNGNNVPGGWAIPDDVELSFYQIVRPIQIRSGSSNKIQHTEEYLKVLINDVIGTSNCTLVNAISDCFTQNRVVYDINLVLGGFNASLNTDHLTKGITVGITGKLAGITTTYHDTYQLNPYYVNSSDAYNYFVPTSSNQQIALTDNLILKGQAGGTNRVSLNPYQNGSISGTFYTCGSLELSVENSSLLLGGSGTTANLEVRSGSYLHLKSGSVLTINNNSTLIVSCGASLIFEPGASIILSGQNARLIINGTLDVRPGANFNYPYITESPVISGPSTISISGSTFSTNLTGSNSYAWTVPNGWRINGQQVSFLQINDPSGSTVSITPSSNSCGLSNQQICVSVSGCAGVSNVCKVLSVESCNEALSFDGVNDYVNIPEKNGRMNFGTGSFVMETFIKSNASGNVRALLSKRTFASGSSSDGFLFGVWSDGRPFIQMKGSPNIIPPSASANLYDGNCHHVAVRRNGTTISFFVDGNFIGNGNYSSNRDISSTGAIRVGADKVTTSAYNGWIGEVRVWSTSLTDQQISSNVNTVIPIQSNLKGYYDMRDISGQQVTDLSSTISTVQNNGTLGSLTGSDTNDPAWLASAQLTCNVQGNFRNKPIKDGNYEMPDSVSILNQYNDLQGDFIYPNPFKDEFVISVNTEETSFVVKIHSLTGAKLFESIRLITNTRHKIEPKIASGVYYLIIEGERRRIYKVVKE